MFMQLCDKTMMLFSFFLLYSKAHKNNERKFEFCETNFRDGANFNNFRRI